MISNIIYPYFCQTACPSHSRTLFRTTCRSAPSMSAAATAGGDKKESKTAQMEKRPELAGVRMRKRKKDIKSKYEPEEFAIELIEQLVAVFPQGVEAVGKQLESLGDKLDYKNYGEIFFDVLFTGGMLGQGGDYVEDVPELSPFCVFKAEETIESIKETADVFNKIIRRYRYLQKSFEDSMSKLLRFINRFQPADVNKLSMCYALLLGAQLCPMSILTALFSDHLVKEGLSLQFVTVLFRTYLKENSLEHLSANIRKNGLEDKLLEFFPPNKRTTEFFSRHFSAENLDDLVKYHTKKASIKSKEEIRDAVVEMISSESPHIEIIAHIKQQAGKDQLTEVEVTEVVFDALMKAIDWPRKPELCEDACIKHFREWSKVLASVVSSAKGEMAVMHKLQVFCYEDARVTKIFSKLVQLLYQLDVVTENAIIYWNTKGALAKGKALFISQIQPFIKWLAEAEEEDEPEQA